MMKLIKYIKNCDVGFVPWHFKDKLALIEHLSQLYEPPHDKTVRPAKTHISLGIRPVWSESSLCTQWVAKDPSFLHADSEDSDQTGRMPRLIWVFAGCTVILLVVSWGSLYKVEKKKFWTVMP